MNNSSAKKSLSRETLKIMFFGAIVPAILIFTTVFLTAYTFVRSDFEKNNLAMLELISRQVYMMIENEKNHLQTLKEIFDARTTKPLDIDMYLKASMDERHFLRSLQAADKNGILNYTYPYSPDIMGTDVSGSNYFSAAMSKDGIYWGASFIYESEDFPVSTASIKYKGGLITVFLSMEQITKLLEAKNLRNGPVIAITDQNGVFVAHTDRLKVERREHDSFYNDFHKEYSGRNFQKNLVVNGKKMRCYAGFIGDSGWSVQIWQPEKGVFSGLRYMFISVAAAMLIILLIVIYFSGRQMLLVKSSINALIDSARSLGEGNRVARVESETFEELMPLTRQFNEMSELVRIREEKLISSEEELKKVVAELKRSNTDLEQFAVISSHDLKEPVRTISVYADILRTKYAGQLDNSGREIIDYIVSGAGRLAQLIKDVLNYSRAGRFDGTAFESIDTAELIREIVEKDFEQGKNMRVEYDREKMAFIKGNRTAIRQVFFNIISNALKFNDSEIPQIDITCKSGEAFNTFYIRDNGIGVNSKYGEKIFEPFEVLNTKDEYEGSGVGLPICKKIIERHGGSIWLESAGEGQGGSTVIFTVPV